MNAISDHRKVPKSLTFLLLLLGAATGWMIDASRVIYPVGLAVVTSLLVVQVPIDVLAHRLARIPTLVAMLTLLVGGVTAFVAGGRWRDLIMQVVVSALLVTVLAVVHWVSSRSLGWGDVLLSAPLAFAVANVNLSAIVVWMLIASSTAATHGLMVRWRSGKRHVPFGPHLLGAAWLVLMFSV